MRAAVLVHLCILAVLDAVVQSLEHIQVGAALSNGGAGHGVRGLPVTVLVLAQAAGRLFREKGYHAVSMRAIAAQLDISVGNLNYYFPRKADLANALLEEQMDQIILPAQPGLDALNQYLRRMMLSLFDHTRLFSDPLVFLSLPELEEGHRARIGRLRQNLLEMLQVQVDAGFLRTGSLSLDDLTDLLMYLHLGWQQQLMLFPQPPLEAVESAMRLQWGMLESWLTPKGRESLAQLRHCTGPSSTYHTQNM